MDHRGHEPTKSGFLASRSNVVLVGFLAIAGFYLVTEHYAHVIPYLPWLLLLACPLMHLFMHGGHGGHGGDQGSGPGARNDRPPASDRR
jgi:DUF2933 family protein